MRDTLTGFWVLIIAEMLVMLWLLCNDTGKSRQRRTRLSWSLYFLSFSRIQRSWESLMMARLPDSVGVLMSREVFLQKLCDFMLWRSWEIWEKITYRVSPDKRCKVLHPENIVIKSIIYGISERINYYENYMR